MNNKVLMSSNLQSIKSRKDEFSSFLHPHPVNLALPGTNNTACLPAVYLSVDNRWLDHTIVIKKSKFHTNYGENYSQLSYLLGIFGRIDFFLKRKVISLLIYILKMKLSF